MDPISPIIKLQQSGPKEVELLLQFPPDLPYFQGHFDDAPILPGVAQIHYAIQLAHQYLGTSKRLKTMEVIKFQQLIRPETNVLLSLSYKVEKSQLYFNYHSESGNHSSGRIKLL